MITLQDKSIVKLIELEEKLNNDRQEEIPGALRDLIDVQKVVLDKLHGNSDDKQASSVEVIQQKLVKNLVRYGAYLKVENQKDYQVEEASLKLATEYDLSNQAAFYRLGVLAYQSGRFTEAVDYFQNALEPVKVSEGYRFTLTPQQKYNATVYIKSSASFTGKGAQASLDRTAGDEYLRNHEYIVVSKEEKRYCSEADYHEIIEDLDSNILILDYTGERIELRFNTRVTSVSLSVLEAELLEELILLSDEDHPLRGRQLQEPIFSNTYRQKVTRLRGLIGSLELSTPVIKNKTIRIGAGRATAHYYNQTLPFLIIYLESEMY